MERIRLLIADDHTLFRQALRRLVEPEEDMVVVGEAANGLEAEQQAQLLSPDVILMDLGMPLLDGAEATRAIMRDNPKAKILVLTMFVEEGKVLEVIRCGARGYVVKDCGAAELAQAVRAVHRGEGYFSPSAAGLIGEGLRRHSLERQGKPALAAQEVKMLSLLAQGMGDMEIAQRLSLSHKTVRNRFSLLFNKLSVKNRTEALLFALKEGVVSLE